MSSDSNPQKGYARVGSAVENKNIGIVSSNYVQSNEEDIPDASFVGIDRGFDKVEEEDDQSFPVEEASPTVYVDEQLNTKRYETITPDTVPNEIPRSSEISGLKFETLEDVLQSNLKEVANEANSVESEGEKPPPLAGKNVMNIILVAAECSPWSKTGNLLFLWTVFFNECMLLSSFVTNPNRLY